MCVGMIRSLFKYINLSCNSRRFVATVINGKMIANNILEEVKCSVQKFKSVYNYVPNLTVIVVGDNPASKVYVNNKRKAADFVGIGCNLIEMSSEIEKDVLVDIIRKLNKNDTVDAILLQLPLPPHLNARYFVEMIAESKDVDGFNPKNLGLFVSDYDCMAPCTALAVQKVLSDLKIDFAGKNAVVCGRSKHVGLPIAYILQASRERLGFDCNTTICHRFTSRKQLETFCRDADVIVSATGIPSLIRGHMVKKGAIVIDVGISRIVDLVTSKTKLVGDVNFGEVEHIASHITPVPGGIGPITVAMMLRNTYLAADRLSRYFSYK